MRKRPPRLRGFDYSRSGAYFVTVVTEGRQCLLTDAIDPRRLTAAGQMVSQVWTDLPARFAKVDLDAFVVMPDHIHGIVILPGMSGGVSLGTVIGAFKSLTTLGYSRGVATLGWPRFIDRLWQTNYYEHVVRGYEAMAQIRQYIVNNPIAWRHPQGVPLQINRRMLISMHLVLSLLLAVQCADGSPPPCAEARPAAMSPRSVAVLNFRLLSRDTTDAYLAEGLADAITSRLSQVRRLDVASRTAARLGRTPRAAYMVSGTILRQNRQLVVTVELLRASTGRNVWAQRYERSDTAVLGTEQDIALAVATNMLAGVTSTERAALGGAPTRNPEAYDHLMRGDFFLAQRTLQGDHARDPGIRGRRAARPGAGPGAGPHRAGLRDLARLAVGSAGPAGARERHDEGRRGRRASDRAGFRQQRCLG